MTDVHLQVSLFHLSRGWLERVAHAGLTLKTRRPLDVLLDVCAFRATEMQSLQQRLLWKRLAHAGLALKTSYISCRYAVLRLRQKFKLHAGNFAATPHVEIASTTGACNTRCRNVCYSNHSSRNLLSLRRNVAMLAKAPLVEVA